MARTSKSRGKGGFTMRSGNKASTNDLSGVTPYPFLGKLLGGAAKGLKNLLPGSGGNNSNDQTVSTEEKVDEIYEAVVGGGSETGIVGNTLANPTKIEDTALTKKSPYHKNIDDKGIEQVAKQNNISVAMVNSIIQEIGDEPGVDAYDYSVKEIDNAVKSYIEEKGERWDENVDEVD
tara:strand:- start:37 stop:567 length:531 start_codon:yes stop_codon:yes gene_type:complete